ncbi:MAG: hypothetical protein GEU73_05005 [Chloroflexi bacterium]|nr:hypothetical protein [Chloroflexota bacterium]
MAWRTKPLPPDWHKTQPRILARDQGICYVCGKPGATQVDHKVPGSQDGSEDDSNLGAIHVSCHRSKTAREANARHRLRKRKPEDHPGML